jgi:AraC family transcriptional regulator
VGGYDWRMASVSPSPAGARLGARAASAAARLEAVEAVVGAMNDRLDRPFSLEEMARMVYLSPYYFNRVFRQITGVPPRRFQTALRMVAAKRLLLTTDLSVTDVCLEVGYRSLGTFATQFHELVGMSPRTLRRVGERPWALSALPLAPACRHDGRAPIGSGAVAGVIAAPDGADRLTFVGLFADPSPQGIPAACTILAEQGPYRIGGVPAGRHHVAAAALPRSSDPRTYLLPDDDDVLVAAADEAVTARAGSLDVRHLRLRPKRRTDPPILIAPHALLGVATGSRPGAEP